MDRIKIYTDKNSLEIKVSWLHPIAYFAGACCVFMIGTLCYSFFLLFSKGWSIGSGVFWILQIIVVYVISRLTLSVLLNNSHIDIQDGKLRVIHRPVPVHWWRKDIDIPIEEIKDIYLEEKDILPIFNSGKVYILRVKLKNGIDKILFGLEGKDVEGLKEIRQHLMIKMGLTEVDN